MLKVRIDRRSRLRLTKSNPSEERSPKTLGILPIRKTKYLEEVKAPGTIRRTVRSLVSETNNTMVLDIEGKNYSFFKSGVKFGYHPTGNLYAVDLPFKTAIEKGLKV